MTFPVFTAANMKTTAFLDVAPCCLTEVDRRFRGAFCLNHQRDEIIVLMTEAVHTSETLVYFNETKRLYIQEGCHFHTFYLFTYLFQFCPIFFNYLSHHFPWIMWRLIFRFLICHFLLSLTHYMHGAFQFFRYPLWNVFQSTAKGPIPNHPNFSLEWLYLVTIFNVLLIDCSTKWIVTIL
jgi:hypothetical protein